MSDDRVLVWHKNYGKDGKAVVHVDGSCPRIVNRNPPRRSVVYGAEIQQGGYRAMRRDDCATRARREIARRACDQHRTTDRGACSSLPRSLLARSLPGSPSHDAHPQARRRGVQRAIGATMAARIE